MTTETAWKQYANGLLDYFKSRVNDHAIAEDLRQEVFLKLHTHRSNLKDSEKIQHWLRKVAHNVLVDHWKGQHKQREVELPPQNEESQKALDHLAEHCVSHLLSTMPTEYANAVRWSDIEGQKQADIADKLQISLSGAKSRVQRGRDMLKQAIIGCCKPTFNERNELVDAACLDKNCG